MAKAKRLEIFNKYNGLCAYTGKPLGDDWQVDHMMSMYWCDRISINPESDDNLMPTLKIVNHYKRAKDIDQFRGYMETFHQRLAKLPKKPLVGKSIKRKKYMLAVAEAFGITPDKPWCGIFYFETLTNKP